MTSETEIVKKLVEALRQIKILMDRAHPAANDYVSRCRDISTEALTEATAWLERQEGKCSEGMATHARPSMVQHRKTTHHITAGSEERMIRYYTVVSGLSLSDLISKVNAETKLGWRPIGGVTATADKHVNITTYMQAMIYQI